MIIWWQQKRGRKKVDNNRKKEKCDNLDTNKLLKNYEKKGKRELHENLDGRRQQVKESDKIRKKQIIKRGNWKMLITHEKELLKSYEKKGKRKLRENLDDK